MTAASGSGRSAVRWLGVLAATAVLVVVLAWQRAQVAPPGDEAGRAPTEDHAAVAPDASRDASAVPEERTPPEQALGAVDPRSAWREQVARTVRPIVSERLGRPPTPAEEERLVDAIGSVGPAARTLDREVLDPDDPRSIARIREQTRVLVEADQTCRALLGIGVAELLRRLDPSSVEDEGGAADG